MKTASASLPGRERVALTITRDSVCLADDYDAPHERSMEAPSCLDPAAFARAVGSGYLPSVAGVGHRWTCLLNEVPIAKISPFATQSLVATTPFAEVNRVHFRYHAARY